MEQNENGAQTPYTLLGGEKGLKDVVARFYALMDTSPDFARLRRLHAPDLSYARTMLFEFLSGWLGGPPLYFQRPERRCVMSAHRRFPIGVQEVGEWLSCMQRALDESGADKALSARVGVALARLAEGMRNRPV